MTTKFVANIESLIVEAENPEEARYQAQKRALEGGVNVESVEELER